MNKDLADDLINEWVRLGDFKGKGITCDPEKVRGYVKRISPGRIYFQRILEAQGDMEKSREIIQRYPDKDLDWRIGELAIKGDEVITLRIRKASEVFGKEYPDRECCPSTEEWGEFGWTYTKASHSDPLAAKIARTIVVAKRRMWMRVRRGTL